MEIWLTKLETFLKTHSIDQARSLFEENGIQAAGAASQGGLLLSRGDARRMHWDLFGRRLEILSALDVGTLVITPDFVAEPSSEDLALAVRSLGEAGELAAAHGVRAPRRSEFQKTARFCASLDSAVALASQVDSPNVGICLDVFHYYTGPSKFEDLAHLSADNLAWVQVCDVAGVPRELAGDADRILPGDGDFRIAPILDHLRRIGYRGFVSLEVLSPQLWQVPASAVADAGLRAMARMFESIAEVSDLAGGP